MPVLCWDRVRYVGDRVAAVAAETREAAEEALALIEVEYEELPAVFDPLEAMKPDAPLMHDDVTRLRRLPAQRDAADLHNGSTRLAWSQGRRRGGLPRSRRRPRAHLPHPQPPPGLPRALRQRRRHRPARAASRSGAPARRPFGPVSSSRRRSASRRSASASTSSPSAATSAARATRATCRSPTSSRKQTGRPVKIVMSYAEELTACNPTPPDRTSP